MEKTSVVVKGYVCVCGGGKRGWVGVVVTIKDSKRELLALIELFCILIVMVVHKYKVVNIHRTVNQKKNHQCY